VYLQVCKSIKNDQAKPSPCLCIVQNSYSCVVKKLAHDTAVNQYLKSNTTHMHTSFVGLMLVTKTAKHTHTHTHIESEREREREIMHITRANPMLYTLLLFHFHCASNFMLHIHVLGREFGPRREFEPTSIARRGFEPTAGCVFDTREFEPTSQ